MVDDATTPSNAPIVLVEKEELEETPLDVNVSQCPREANRLEKWCAPELIIQHRIVEFSYNPHALTIYLKFVLAHEVVLERFKEC